jgi:hypothetical protein
MRSANRELTQAGMFGTLKSYFSRPIARKVGRYGFGLSFCCEFPFALTLWKSGIWTQSPPWRVIFE